MKVPEICISMNESSIEVVAVEIHQGPWLDVVPSHVPLGIASSVFPDPYRITSELRVDHSLNALLFSQIFGFLVTASDMHITSNSGGMRSM